MLQQEVACKYNFCLKAIENEVISKLSLHRVDDRLRIKVTDIGLSRDLFPDDYHCLGDSENRPIKWMALESLTHKEYSSASDVVIKLKTIDRPGFFLLKIKLNIEIYFYKVVFWRTFVGVNHPSPTAVR